MMDLKEVQSGAWGGDRRGQSWAILDTTGSGVRKTEVKQEKQAAHEGPGLGSELGGYCGAGSQY